MVECGSEMCPDMHTTPSMSLMPQVLAAAAEPRETGGNGRGDSKLNDGKTSISTGAVVLLP